MSQKPKDTNTTIYPKMTTISSTQSHSKIDMDEHHSEDASFANSSLGTKESKTGGSLLKKRNNQHQLVRNLTAKTLKTDC